MNETNEPLRIEAALCIWEAMLEAHEHAEPKPGIVGHTVSDWHTSLYDAWMDRGTVEMRHAAIGLADAALETFDLIGGTDGAEALGLIPYDWEFIPAFLRHVEWDSHSQMVASADTKAIAAKLKDGKCA